MAGGAPDGEPAREGAKTTLARHDAALRLPAREEPVPGGRAKPAPNRVGGAR